MGRYRWLSILHSIHESTQIQPKSFNSILSSPTTLLPLKSAKISRLSSTYHLLSSLAQINKPKLLMCLLLFSLSLGLTVAGPWIVNYLVRSLLDDGAVLKMLGLMVGYKVTGAAVSTISDYLYTSLGFQYFAALYWSVLDIPCHSSYSSSIGKLVNIVEYDINLLSNIVYSTLTSLFYFTQIIVLFVILGVYLRESEPYSLFLMLVVGWVVSQIGGNVLTYYVNRRYITQKDRRLAANVAQHDEERMLIERKRQLRANRYFLLTKVLCKSISLLFPLLLNIYVFLLADRSTITDNQYTILILINLIRTPVSSLMVAMNLNAQIVNSCRRIVELLGGRDGEESNERVGSESTESKQNLEGLVQMERKMVGRGRVSRQVGNIQLNTIIRWLTKAIPKRYWLLLIFSFLALLLSRYYNNKIFHSLLSSQSSPFLYLGLTAQMLTPLLFYVILIFSIHKVTSALFTKLPQYIDYQVLNRISGDISSVDRTATINAFEIGSNFTLILGSYLYSIVSLQLPWLVVLLIVFLAGAVYMAYSLNRFVMKSRREVYRHELQMKAEVLAGVLAGEKISESVELQHAWSHIFQCKTMGLLIQNYYVLLISFLMLCLSLIFITLSQYLISQTTTKSVLLMICLSLDSDMLMLFYAMVRLELSLVSFQRVVNVLKRE